MRTHHCGIERGKRRKSTSGLYMRSDRSSPTPLDKDHLLSMSLLDRNMLTRQLLYYMVKCPSQQESRLDSNNAWYPQLPKQVAPMPLERRPLCAPCSMMRPSRGKTTS